MKKHFFIQTHAASKAALLAMTVLVLVFAGCASNASDTTDLSDETADSADAQSTDTAAEASADAADTAVAQDAGAADDSTGASQIGAAADSSETAYTYPVSEEEALSIALEDAGLEADSITVTISELIVEEAYACWSIEFYSDVTKYDYEIDANTGEMLSRTMRSTQQ